MFFGDYFGFKKKFKKLSLTLKNNYTSSLNYLNSKQNKLSLYFERNNNFFLSPNNIKNTYHNSKWLGLVSENIKNKFIIFLFFISFISLFLYFYFNISDL